MQPELKSTDTNDSEQESLKKIATRDRELTGQRSLKRPRGQV